MSSQIIRKIEKENIARVQSSFNVHVGDTVRVHYKTSEKNSRIFQGIIIRKKNNWTCSSIDVLQTSADSGLRCRRMFFLYSGNVKIDLISRPVKRIRRAYLKYMERLHGKRARLL